MIIPFHHHRVFKIKKYLYFAEDFPEKVESSTLPEKEEEPEANVNLKQKLDKLELEHGEETYRATIKDMVDQISDPTHRRSILEDSVKRYMGFYQIKIEEFKQNTEALEVNYKQTVEAIQKRTQKELDILKTTIKEHGELAEIEIKTPPPLSEQQEISHHFGAYLKELNERYFESRLENQENQADYEGRAKDFQDRIAHWADTRIQNIQEAHGTTNDLKQLKVEIHQVYRNIASLDKQSGHINYLDLKLMLEQINPNLNQIDDFLEQDDEALKTHMETEKLTDPEAWEDTLESYTKTLLHTVEEEGLQDQFTELVKVKMDKNVMNYRRAKRKFSEEVKRLGKISVDAAIQYTQDFNRELFEPFIQSETTAINEYEWSTFKVQISRQLDHLLSGRTIPKSPTDQILVAFMRGDRKKREEILRQPQQRQDLMRAIAQCTNEKGYPQEFKQYSITKKTNTSGDLSKPSYHDKAARIKALMILGEQAEAIVEHYEPGATTEADKKFAPKGAEVAWNFEVSGVKNVRFRSALERGGFNTRDLALKGMKVFGAITVLTNIVGAFNSKDARDQETLVGRIGKALEMSVTNPALAVGVGATVLGHKAEKDPRYIRYFWMSPHEQADVRTADKLDQIAGKVKRERLNHFLGNEAEWKVMERLDQQKLWKLNQLANKKRMEDFKAKKEPKKVGISPEMMVEAGILDPQKDQALIQNMGQGLNRTRFLFYNNFLNQKNINIYNLKQHCTGSSFIA